MWEKAEFCPGSLNKDGIAEPGRALPVGLVEVVAASAGPRASSKKPEITTNHESLLKASWKHRASYKMRLARLR